MRFTNTTFGIMTSLGCWSATFLLLSSHRKEAGVLGLATVLIYLTWVAYSAIAGEKMKKAEFGWVSFGSLILALLLFGVFRAFSPDFVTPLISEAMAQAASAFANWVVVAGFVMLLLAVFKREGFHLPLELRVPTAPQGQTGP